MKQLIVLIGAIFCSLSIFGQTVKVTGKVFDVYTGNPLPDVSIHITDGTGAKTDENGAFSIACQVSKEITVSHVSYEAFKFICTEQSKEMKIGLIPTSYNLNEVSITS